MNQLAGKVMLITGGARGIGLAIAESAAKRGAKVAVADIEAPAAIAAATGLGEGCRGYGLDVTDGPAFDQVIDQVESGMGPLDVLVNNAGIAEASPRVGEQPRELVDRIIDVNLNGVINGTLGALRVMEPRGRGRIVNVAFRQGISAYRPWLPTQLRSSAWSASPTQSGSSTAAVESALPA
jgi:NAD(P)-dependent dehydrogenase (short-subunit alcohol dehydrogenase family)